MGRLLLGAALLLLSGVSHGQTTPALIGSGPDALVNQIDVERLAAKGQGDGMLMLTAFIMPDGKVLDGWIFRQSPKSAALVSEVRARLQRCRFIPAVQNGKKVPVQIFCTVLFFTAEGKPRLRVFANADPEEVKSMSDFVAPQLIVGTSNWAAAKEHLEGSRRILSSGSCEAAVTVDRLGAVKEIRILNETPKGFRFGEGTELHLKTARFIPGFRNGQPVDCTFVYTQIVKVQRMPWG